MGDSDKFCAKCGLPAVARTKSKTTDKGKGFFGSYGLSGEELKFQVEHYGTLPISKSSRGIAVLTIGGLLIFGILLGLFLGATSDFGLTFYDVFWSAIIYAPFLYFVYRGHLWAFVGLGLLYTVDKFYTVYTFSSGDFNFSALIFWLIGIAPLWVAFKVERERRKRQAIVIS